MYRIKFWERVSTRSTLRKMVKLRAPTSTSFWTCWVMLPTSELLRKSYPKSTTKVSWLRGTSPYRWKSGERSQPTKYPKRPLTPPPQKKNRHMCLGLWDRSPSNWNLNGFTSKCPSLIIIIIALWLFSSRCDSITILLFL